MASGFPVVKLPVVFMLSFVMFLAACSDGAGETEGAFHPDNWTGALPPDDLYDPVRAREELPGGYRQVLGRDSIKPLYDPLFLTAGEVDWPEDELVIGVDLRGEARAYPVGFLNRREIVVDLHRGVPTFVTW